jgi:hypothetical protein
MQANSARGTATIAVNVPRIRLVLSAAIQVAEPKKFSYQRNEHARGGNSRRFDAEKESGTTTSVGSIKNAITSAEKPHRRMRTSRCPDRPQAWTALSQHSVNFVQPYGRTDLAIVLTSPFFHILEYSISEFVIHSRDGQTYPLLVTNGIHSHIHQGLISARMVFS